MLITARDVLVRIVLLGVSEDDGEEERLRQAGTTLVALIMTVLSPIWVATYLLIDRPLSAAIPGTYALISIAMLGWIAWRGAMRGFVPVQMACFLVLPLALQASMGGFVHGSVVSMWAFAAPLLALVVSGPRAAAWWFGAFAAAIVVSAAFEPALSDAVEAPARGVQLSFFALDITFPLMTALLVVVYFARQRDAARAQTEELLGHILPASVIARLKRGEGQIAERHEEATVLFADIVGFTAFADSVAPERIVSLLSRAFVQLDALTEAHGLEKIKTLGDGYVAVAGVTSPRPDHAAAATAMALEVEPVLIAALGADWPELRMRVGLATGPVMAGVIGSERFSFDVWGDTVNTASRMSTYAEPGGVLVTPETRAAIADRYRSEERKAIDVKGKGPMTTYLVTGPLQGSLEDGRFGPGVAAGYGTNDRSPARPS
jgi:guanylate cyclase